MDHAGEEGCVQKRGIAKSKETPMIVNPDDVVPMMEKNKETILCFQKKTREK